MKETYGGNFVMVFIVCSKHPCLCRGNVGWLLGSMRVGEGRVRPLIF